MESELNTFQISDNNGSFNPSPSNNETLDEVQAKEVYDYQNLTRYASIGKGISRGIIALGTLTAISGVLMGTSSISSMFGSYPSVGNIRIVPSEESDSISYSFSTSNSSNNHLRFFLLRNEETEPFFELDVSLSNDYAGNVENIGYGMKVSYFFELWNEQDFSEIMETGIVYTMNERSAL